MKSLELVVALSITLLKINGAECWGFWLPLLWVTNPFNNQTVFNTKVRGKNRTNKEMKLYIK